MDHNPGNTLDSEGLMAEATRIVESEMAPVRRRLAEGESVDVSEIGLPGAVMSGAGVEIDEYPDGTRTAVIPQFGHLVESIFAQIVGRVEGPMAGAELIFVRRTLEFSQQELAERAGCDAAAIRRMESGESPVSPLVAKTARLHGMARIVNRLPASIRAAHGEELAALQDALSTGLGAASDEGRYLLPGSRRVELATR